MIEVYTHYEQGLQTLLERLGKEHYRYTEALTLQARLLENIALTRQYGDTETRRAERAQIMNGLNDLSIAVLGVSFNELATLGDAAVSQTDVSVQALSPLSTEETQTRIHRDIRPEGLQLTAPAQIFLSYAREDKEKIERLYQQLSDAGFKPWMDTKDILPGERWELAIQEAIRCSDFFLVCLSRTSVDKRGWIQREIREALDILKGMFDRDIYLIPVRLEDCEAPRSLRDFQWVNLFEEDGWTRLVKAIQVGVGHRAEVIKPIVQESTPFEPYLAHEKPFPGAEIATPEKGPERVQTDNSTKSAKGLLPTMILIPSGRFVMGASSHDPWSLESERPQHTHTTDSYYVSKYPITNIQYHAFVEATGYRAPKNWDVELSPHVPVTRVSWYDCLEYCRWLTEVTGREFRLPTEAEWEKAARGKDGYRWPWGNEFDEMRCNIVSDLSSEGIIEVGTLSPFGDSPYGISDMAGNVWEWTSSLLMSYPYAYDERENIDIPSERVLRGGSWRSSKKGVRCTCRKGAAPSLRQDDIGFRVACSEKE